MPAIRKCATCTGMTKRGVRCTRRTCKTFPYCWQHLLSECGLKVTQSTIPGAGQGLFAVKDFKKNARITRYSGDIKPSDFRSDYAVDCRTWTMDAQRTNTYPGRYANTAERKRRQPVNGGGQRRRMVKANARLVCDNRNKRVSVKAKQNIKATRANPKEIVVSYGSGFRL